MGFAMIATIAFASGFTSAAEIHKCASASGIIYQGEACGSDQRQLAVLTTVSGASRAETAHVYLSSDLSGDTRGDATQPVRGKQWLPFEGRSLAPGMTDDEVLNVAGGGVPTRIMRTRDGKTWRETWIYETRAGMVRALQFVNGRLESAEDAGDIAQLRLAGTP